MINECNIVRDLLPIYADKATSADSEKFVSRHLADCEDCKLYYKSVTKTTPKAKTTTELPLSHYEMVAKKLKKSKLVKHTLVAGGFAGAAVFCALAYIKGFSQNN